MKKNNRIELGFQDFLVIVDLQNDFCPPDGSLAVPGGDRIVPVVNELIVHFQTHGGVVVATKDWHEGQHDGWPLHCIRGTAGADFHPDLQYPRRFVYYKGYRGGKGSGYSGFDAVSGVEREGDVVLREEHSFEYDMRISMILAGMDRIFVVGLATDYCVKATVLDGLKLGFEVYVITDAIAAVNVNPGDGEKALEEMATAGAHLVASGDILDAEGCGDCGECEGCKDCKWHCK
jgi:nicotinamidase/pyrazinamidase